MGGVADMLPIEAGGWCASGEGPSLGASARPQPALPVDVVVADVVVGGRLSLVARPVMVASAGPVRCCPRPQPFDFFLLHLPLHPTHRVLCRQSAKKSGGWAVPLDAPCFLVGTAQSRRGLHSVVHSLYDSKRTVRLHCINCTLYF